jgi:hypothetical protein
MPTSRTTPKRPHRLRRALAGTGVLASVVVNVWAVTQAVALRDTDTAPVRVAQPARTPAPTVAVPQKGDGRFTVVEVASTPTGTVTTAPASTPTSGATPSATRRVVRYTVETEGGLGAETSTLASTVSTVLTDPRGWQTRDGVRFVNVSAAEAARGAKVDVRVTLASPDTTDRLCAPLDTRGEVSCHAGGRAVLNLRRWQLGVEAYGTDLTAYRTYLVNHEVGHSLGHGHVDCPGPRKDAPVMMQQTYGLDGCLAWPWPMARVG